jgi:hypothetical protein
MKARARQRRGGGGPGGNRNPWPGCPGITLRNAIATPFRPVSGLASGCIPWGGAFPCRSTVAQCRSFACLPLRGQRRHCSGIDLRSAPASRFIPSDEGPPGHLKPAHYLRRNARLSIVMTATPAGVCCASGSRRPPLRQRARNPSSRLRYFLAFPARVRAVRIASLRPRGPVRIHPRPLATARRFMTSFSAMDLGSRQETLDMRMRSIII